MARMITRRLLIAIPLLLLVSFLVYALTAAPGADPARAILGEGRLPRASTRCARVSGSTSRCWCSTGTG